MYSKTINLLNKIANSKQVKMYAYANNKKIVISNNTLTNTYKQLYKNYNCTLKQLSFIQFAYNSSLKHNLSFKYNCAYNYKQLKQCINAM